MADRLVHVGEGFWNVRGSFKIAGLIDIGNQTSLVQLASGRFILLDSYALQGEVHETVMGLTDQGRAIEAVLNLHPFHTVHTRAVHAALPHATHYGTRRHKDLFPDLTWADRCTEDPETAERFAADLELSVPDGVLFVPRNDKLHFASVLAFHPKSRTLHVDDTLTFTRLPFIGGLGFHPTLAQVLERRAGAAADFRAWATAITARCDTIEHVCTAHMRTLPPEGPFGDRVRAALAAVEGKLAAHEARWG